MNDYRCYSRYCCLVSSPQLEKKNGELLIKQSIKKRIDATRKEILQILFSYEKETLRVFSENNAYSNSESTYLRGEPKNTFLAS